MRYKLIRCFLLMLQLQFSLTLFTLISEIQGGLGEKPMLSIESAQKVGLLTCTFLGCKHRLNLLYWAWKKIEAPDTR